MISDQAFVLHKKPYKDSSELIKLMTRQHGLVDVVGQGSRRPKSKLRGQLQPFVITEVSFTGRSALKTLVQAEQQAVAKSCAYLNHVSMLYCSELLLLMGLDEEAVTVLFPVYQATIKQLFEARQVSLVLRRFEWQLCCELGYELRIPAGTGTRVVFHPENGLEFSAARHSCSVAVWQNFVTQLPLDPAQLKQVNRLMKSVVNHLVHGKAIQSRELLLTQKLPSIKH